MRILAIDPGTRESAMVYYAPSIKKIGEVCITENEGIADILTKAGPMDLSKTVLAIEMVACYGMPVGREVFETVLWIGRFIQAWQPRKHALVYRRDVKLHLCNSARAKDANIRQALLDKFPAAGGGATPQVGTKAQPGPLYGIKSHLWAALAVAVTYAEHNSE